ncbi:MAG: preprotein translocase subunit SecA [Candidatus Marinimicrobia bacterium]|nr:preprotein translocase subunit SecA [Candidatus Neomarinimicrobiota bacterium]
MGIFGKIIGDTNDRFLKKCSLEVDKINKLENDFESLSDDELKVKTLDFKKKLKNGASLDDILPEAFAAVRESAKRTLGQRHFDSQILGGIALHQGKITEMKTGEGKTLSATLPVYLNALVGKGVHVVTVNDYLSRRDTAWMGQVYNALGLSVGCINHDSSFLYDSTHIKAEEDEEALDKTRDTQGGFKVVHEYLRPCDRKEAYSADITYGTNNEFGFDYLRDSMVYPAVGGADQGPQIAQKNHYFAIVDEVDSILIDEARTPLIISVPDEESADLYKIFAKIAPQLKEGEHFTIDEKQKAVSINEEGIEKAEKLLGVGDIYTEKGIKYVHHLNQALRANALFKKDKDYVVKNGEIIIVDEFTGRLMPGRRWSEGLHQAIEAKEGVFVQKESRTLASITFQNYFRMYEKLSGMTGTALTSAEEFDKVYGLEVVNVPSNKPFIRKDKSDLVFSTEEGKFKAVVEEIRERNKKGQPVLVGTVSIDKNEYLSTLLKKEGIAHRLLNAKHHEEEGDIIARAGRRGKVTVATNMAGRGVDIMLGGVKSIPSSGDSVGDEGGRSLEEWEKERKEVLELGGLFVLGTERHDARRIDNQLRGRSGRQGDPGESRFFVSLEDSLMRIFGSEKIKNMMKTMGVPEDVPIENRMVSRAIESAQSKIEGLNFDARKHILDYDDVMNKQRVKIYKMRKDVLFADEEFLNNKAKDILKEAGEDTKILEEKKKEFPEGQFFQAQKNLFLRIIDTHWIDHLEMMDYARSSVGLRAYGNRDPLVEYKNEAIRLFRDLENSINATFVKLILNIKPTVSAGGGMPMPAGVQKIISSSNNKNNSTGVGRNDPCPCGSGKKYKKCCGK